MTIHTLEPNSIINRDKVRGGDIVRLMPGEWDQPLILHNWQFDEGVTFMPEPSLIQQGANADNVWALPQLIIGDTCHGITFDGLRKLHINDEVAGSQDELVTINGDDCHITRCFVSKHSHRNSVNSFIRYGSLLFTNLENLEFEHLLEDLPNGIVIRGDSSSAIDNGSMFTHYAIQAMGEYSVVKENYVGMITGDHIRALAESVTVSQNSLELAFNVSDLDENGHPKEHNDAIQAWDSHARTPQQGTIGDLSIYDNTIVNDSSIHLLAASLQGIGCFDGAALHPHITNNTICTDHDLGICLGYVEGATLASNKCFDPSGKTKPRIHIGTSKVNETCLGNIKNSLFVLTQNQCADYHLDCDVLNGMNSNSSMSEAQAAVEHYLAQDKINLHRARWL